MKLYIFHDVMYCLRIEMDQFTIKHICLIPTRMEDDGVIYWAMTDARTSKEETIELESSEMTIWVPKRCGAELDGQVMVRGRRGFKIGVLTDEILSQATLFTSKNDEAFD